MSGPFSSVANPFSSEIAAPDLHSLVRSLFLFACVGTAAVLWRCSPATRATKHAAAAAGIAHFMFSLPADLLCVHLGVHRYAFQRWMYFGVPVDLHLGWACLWGAGLCLAWDWVRPSRRVALACAVVGLTLGWDALAVYSGCLLEHAIRHWYWVDLGLLSALAALTLGFFKLVREGRWLPFRARFYALSYFLIFYALLPSLIVVLVSGESALTSAFLAASKLRLALAGGSLLLFSALGIWATRHFSAHGKGTPLPLDPAQALVTSGPYAYARNPMQISGLGVTVTLALFFNSLYLWVYVLDVIILLQFTKVWEDEELSRRFGADYEKYAASVRRWRPRRRKTCNILRNLS